jgi:hypothetical protein
LILIINKEAGIPSTYLKVKEISELQSPLGKKRQICTQKVVSLNHERPFIKLANSTGRQIALTCLAVMGISAQL